MRIRNTKRTWLLAAIVGAAGLTGTGVAVAGDDGDLDRPAVQDQQVVHQPADDRDDRDDERDDRDDERDERDGRDDRDDERDDRDDLRDDRDDRDDDQDDDRDD